MQISTLRKLLGPDVITHDPRARLSLHRSAGGRCRPGIGCRHGRTGATVAAADRCRERHARSAPLLQTNLPERLPALIGRDDDLAGARRAVAGHARWSPSSAPAASARRCWRSTCCSGSATAMRTASASSNCAGLTEPRPGGRHRGGSHRHTGRHGSGDGGLDTLVQAVAPLALLIALDNAEHLLDEVARVAAALHAGAPRVDAAGHEPGAAADRRRTALSGRRAGACPKTTCR